jgi:hypothetical protein
MWIAAKYEAKRFVELTPVPGLTATDVRADARRGAPPCTLLDGDFAVQALRQAATSGVLEDALAALAAGASVDALDTDGQSGTRPPRRAFCGRRVQRQAPTRYLLSAAVHRAVRQGHDALLALLLAHGANPDVRNAQGQTPLHLAALAQRVRCGRSSRVP